MRRRLAGMVIGVALASLAGTSAGHEEREHGGATMPSGAVASGHDQTLTGEVVDVLCYLSHGKEGLGKGHADCGKKCVGSGLPVAIKVGDQLYLAAMASHDPVNKKLAEYVGEQVTVTGDVLEKDGQRLIAIESVEKAQ
ncbi:MAG: hypothetical protein HYZ92_03340 [Candidatus Omnitrophica bacterium]|nr:hypothetical protein [Candidatus Omnitrophota bacterium]